ncbi:MAG: hypothetical protein J1E36_05610 [Eubacterium sp.]|nr:hypothetical protein [Eubacterium sp.]
MYRTKYRSENEFTTAVKNYIIFYNEKRPHTKMDTRLGKKGT